MMQLFVETLGWDMMTTRGWPASRRAMVRAHAWIGFDATSSFFL